MNKNKTKRNWIIFVSILILGLAAWAIIHFNNNKEHFVFDTVKVEFGSISNTITATGTIEAINTVQVGTQVSGVIEKIYVDFNSVVKKGDLLAVLDKSSLESSLASSKANLDQAIAKFNYEKSNYQRVKALYDKKLIAAAEYDLALYNYRSSEASVKSSTANYEKSTINLSYTNIYSPIDGVILNRAVDEGQTVAASFNTPELFNIAQDLTQMEVQAAVDEADIGLIEVGQRVEFTVDAFPEEIFNGSVREIWLQPVETSNVITYTVVVDAPNNDLKLKPGMTASITDYVEEISNILVLPGKAIRFSPDREMIMKYRKSLADNQQIGELNPRGDGSQNQRGSGRGLGDGSARKTGGGNGSGGGNFNREMPKDMKRIWIKKGATIQPKMIKIGADDGAFVQILSGLEDGEEVITKMEISEVEQKNEKSETAKNPFMPQRPGRGGRK